MNFLLCQIPQGLKFNYVLTIKHLSMSTEGGKKHVLIRTLLFFFLFRLESRSGLLILTVVLNNYV